MLDGKKALALSMQYTEDSLDGVGAIAGKPCQIQSITDITGGHRITFLWVDNEDVSHTSTLDVMDGQNGKGIASIEKKSTEGLVDTYTITYTDGTTFDFEVTNGVGVPEGGTTGQVLAKKSNSDYDTEWVNGGGGDVSSVNGKTGAVVLDADDVGAVAKVQGKGLSENDYTDTDKAIVDGVTSALAEKVDKVSGKGLSENDYTNEDKTLVGTISSKANQTEVDDISNVYGAKNLLPYPCNGTTRTVAGVTYTDNDDGTFTANGEATALSDLALYSRGGAGFPLKAGTYTLSGAPEGSSADTYCIYVRGTGSSALAYMDFGSGVTFTLDDDEANMGIYLRVKSGVTVSDLTYKPMVRLASVKDDTYVPYAETNKQLTDRPNEFIGTQAEWGALTSQQKKKYQLVNLTDDAEADVVEEFELTADSSVTTAHVEAWKEGHTVHIIGTWQSTSGFTGYGAIFTIPQKYRPKENAYGCGIVTKKSDTSMLNAFYMAKTTGEITQNQSSAIEFKDGTFNFEYPID